jgi:hypothetical protein
MSAQLPGAKNESQALAYDLAKWSADEAVFCIAISDDRNHDPDGVVAGTTRVPSAERLDVVSGSRK